MAKFKPAGKKTKAAPGSYRGLVPCLIIVVGLLLVVYLLFYLVIKSGT